MTQEINGVVDTCLKEKDYTTHNFMQWYVSEQIEEEALARTLIDKLNLIGNDKGGLYLFDRDLEGMTASQCQAAVTRIDRWTPHTPGVAAFLCFRGSPRPIATDPEGAFQSGIDQALTQIGRRVKCGGRVSHGRQPDRPACP